MGFRIVLSVDKASVQIFAEAEFDMTSKA
jgi:hypothetical protein